jgi:hypothetical protein
MNAPTKTLSQVLREVLSQDLPNYEMRARISDWLADVEEDRQLLMDHARAIKRGQPIASLSRSAEVMADIACRIL